MRTHTQSFRWNCDRSCSTALTGGYGDALVFTELNLSLSLSLSFFLCLSHAGSSWPEGRRGSAGSTRPHCKYLRCHGNYANGQSADFFFITKVTSGKFWIGLSQQVAILMIGNGGDESQVCHVWSDPTQFVSQAKSVRPQLHTWVC